MGIYNPVTRPIYNKSRPQGGFLSHTVSNVCILWYNITHIWCGLMRRKNNILIYAICASLCVCGDAYSAIKIEQSSFPATASDISFSAKIDLLTADYKNYEGLSPYEIITIEDAEQQRQRDQENMSHDAYCQEYPLDDICNPTPETEALVMEMGYDRDDDAQDDAPQGLDPAVKPQQPKQTWPKQLNPQMDDGNNQTAMNNSVVGGKCTPSERNTHFDRGDWHKLTSHRYDASNPVFAKAMFTLMRVERPECHDFKGKYGGMTCYGYASVFNKDINVTKLTLTEAEDRTFKMFYKDTGIYKLPDHIMGDVMHASFWRGTAKGVKSLYTVLGVSCKRCSVVSDDLVAAAKNYRGDLHNKYWDHVWTEMQSYKSNRKYLKPFAERIKLVRKNGCHSPSKNPIVF